MTITLYVPIESRWLAEELLNNPETMMDVLAEIAVIAESDPQWDLADAHSGSHFHQGVAPLLEELARQLTLADEAPAPPEEHGPTGAWQPIKSAPKTGADMIALSIFGWCPDPTAPDGGDWRVCWWEPKIKGGCWWGDRDIPEHPTLWMPLPPPPQERE